MSTRMALKAAAACLAGVIALPAMAQIPVPPPPPLPDLHVRVVEAAPPPPRHEVIVYRERPARNYVWVRGFYDWQGDGWVWAPGHWLAPPAQSVRWVSPRYVRVEDGWWYEPAHWSNQQVVVEEKFKKEKFKVKKEKVKIKKEKIKKEKLKD
jgi:YXWGXW repeat-containing protein